jgi:hypothetical protein
MRVGGPFGQLRTAQGALSAFLRIHACHPTHTSRTALAVRAPARDQQSRGPAAPEGPSPPPHSSSCAAQDVLSGCYFLDGTRSGRKRGRARAIKEKPRPRPGLKAKMRVETAMMASINGAVGSLPDQRSWIEHRVSVSRCSRAKPSSRSWKDRDGACWYPSPPILLRLALHCRRLRVLHLKPIGRTAGAVGRPLTLGHDAFEPELAGYGGRHPEIRGIWPPASGSEPWAHRPLVRAFTRASARFFRHLSHLQPRRVMTLVR